MIRPLRRAHRVSILALALLLPPAYLAALAARPARAPVVTFPAKSQPTYTVSRDAFGRLALEVDSRGAPTVPDALVYWLAQLPAKPALPNHAVLLGALPQGEVRSFDLPYPAREHLGVVLVFSLPWQTRVAEIPLANQARAEASP